MIDWLAAGSVVVEIIWSDIRTLQIRSRRGNEERSRLDEREQYIIMILLEASYSRFLLVWLYAWKKGLFFLFTRIEVLARVRSE